MSQAAAPLALTVDSAALARRLQELALISEAPAPVVTRVRQSRLSKKSVRAIMGGPSRGAVGFRIA
jgi:hypothetical protein